MKSIINFIIFTAMLALIVTCGKKENTYPDPEKNARAGGFLIETKPFEIGEEKYKADYGTITVPENRKRSKSRLIHIPFLRIHSGSKKTTEPIFALNGGPGFSNMAWDWGLTSMFLAERDFIAVGFRGVDGSVVLECPEVSEAFKGGSDPIAEESLKGIGKAWTKCADRLKKQGVDLDAYTMIDVIDDNEAVRKALGYNRINLFSVSYGTRIAYLYGLRYPESILRSAMVSVNPPGGFVWEPETIDEQLKYYSNLWNKDTVMSKKSPDLRASIYKVLNNMPRKWLFIKINPGKVKIVTFALLYHRTTAAMVFDTYIAAEYGDASGLAIMSLAYDYMMPSMQVWGDCASKAVSADFDSTRNYNTDMAARKNMPLGSPTSKVWGSFKYGKWPVKQIPEEYRKEQQSGVETLLLSGNIDFSTPAESATKRLLPYLKNGKQIIFSEYGHVGDVLYVNVEDSRLILKSFYNTGIADISLHTYIPMDFNVKWGFPVIAKAAVGVISFLVIVLVAAIVWFIRRYRKRQAIKIIGNNS
jgi:pimeloyl-ACP methyl ester carboxylesterase